MNIHAKDSRKVYILTKISKICGITKQIIGVYDSEVKAANCIKKREKIVTDIKSVSEPEYYKKADQLIHELNGCDRITRENTYSTEGEYYRFKNKNGNIEIVKMHVSKWDYYNHKYCNSPLIQYIIEESTMNEE